MEKKRILIVEDEVIIATEVEYKIKSFGYDSLGIANSLDLIENILSKHTPDLLLMDINLNLDIDGIEIAQKIRATKNIPVIFMTSYSDTHTLERAQKANPYGYILKPYEDRNLKVTLEMAFSKFEMELQIQESEQKYEKLYQSLPIGMYKTTIDGHFLMINHTAAKLLGYNSPEELLGTNLNKLFQNQSFNREDFINDIQEVDLIQDLEYLWVREDKKSVYLQENSRAIRDENGELLYFEGTLQDITEKKIAEEKITKLNMMYSSLKVDPTENIKIIVNKAKEILHATSSVYYKADLQTEGQVIVQASSSLPDVAVTLSPIEGEICYDTTVKSRNRLTKIINLAETPYYKSDPLVRKLELKSYIAHPVVTDGNFLGCLSVMYNSDKKISSTDIQIISTLSKSLALEEARLKTLNLLAVSESKYRDMVDNVHDHIFQVNNNYELVSFNKEFERIFSLDSQNESRCDKLCAENILPDYREAIKSVFENGKPLLIESSLVRSNDRFFYETSFTPIFNDFRKVNGVIGLGRDITSQKVMEKVIGESEKRFRSIFEKIDTLAVQGCNEKHKITYWNKASEKFYGFSAAEVMGDNIDDVLHVVNSEESSAERGECLITRKDGSKIKISRSTVVISNFYGKPEYYSLDMDLTDLTKTRSALENSEKQFQKLTSISPMGVMLMNKNGMVEYVNKKMVDLCGVGSAELLGENHFRFVHPDDVRDVKRYWFDAIGTRSNIELEYRYKTFSGQINWVLASIKPYSDVNGNLKGYLGVLADISARKQTENELNTHQDHVKLINKILRHDLTNNLTVINSALRLYNRTHDEKMLHEATKNIKKGFELIDRMRELELYISDHNNLTIYNVMKVLKEILTNYPNIEFKISGKGQVIADEAIYPIFDNIISNAIKHGGAEKIDVTVSEENGFANIMISDYGSGISKNIKNRIFEERFTYGNSGGSGLGLYIVKTNIERYEGEVEVLDHLPKGTTFLIKLRSV